ncbi:hypothetical protein ARMGADRAFT_1027336 [Armillaria gallica]|uniref:Uncharacterized protein n=1 Tax=Armillaria gallica TaxID=47427 RepID=A0A2H3EBN7_ARMGA|nr:hypothetical protein ARMGADRAFT_1027336 [Armillaria gallica]
MSQIKSNTEDEINRKQEGNREQNKMLTLTMSKEGSDGWSNFHWVPEATVAEVKVLLNSGSLVVASQRRDNKLMMLVVGRDVAACGYEMSSGQLSINIVDPLLLTFTAKQDAA